MKKLSLWGGLLLLFCFVPLDGKCQLYWNTNGTSGNWTDANWSSTGSSPFTTSWSNNSNTEFTANSSITYVTGTPIGNVTVSGSSTTVTFTSAGTLTTSGNIRTIDVGSGCTLDFNGQDVSTAAGTGFIKNGTGIWNFSGQSGAFPGGFTLNSGTVIVSGNNSFGTGAMNINGGILQSSSTLTFAVSSLTVGGNFTLSGTGNDIWGMGVDLGSSTRTITNSTSGGNRTFSGAISGSGGLTFSGSGSGPIIFTGTNTYTGTTTVSGGTLQLNKSGGGTLPSSNNCVVSGGTLQISSNQTLNDVTLSSGTIVVDNGITLTINGNFSRHNSTTITLTGTGSIQYGGSSTLTYNGSSSQTPSSSEFPNSGGPQNVIIDNSAGVTFPGTFNRTISGNLTLTSGTLGDGGNTITLGGSILGTGTHSGSGKILMTGSSQTISGAILQNLELNNAGGFNLSGTTTVNGTLTFTSGKLTLGSNNLILANGASVSGASSSNYVVTNSSGYLQRNSVTSSTDFPVGNSTYNPINIVNSGTSDNFTVNVADDVLTAGTSGTVLTTNAVDRTWTVTEGSAGSSNVTLTVQWNSSDELTSFARGSCYLSHFTGGIWVDNSAGSASGSNPYSISRSGITSFSPFGVGSGGALPVLLINLKTKKIKEGILISWTTATEINNDYFSIERQVLTGEYEKIGTVKGAGNSTTKMEYSFLDKNPVLNSTNFYRLVQHDFNGVNETFGPVLVKFENPFLGATLKPNPFKNILVLTLDNELIIDKIVVTDMIGAIVIEQWVDENNLTLNTETWKPGNYFITLLGPGFNNTMRQVKF
ncbi:MAG: T9SS type A sorting domain-containing protein [Bacteroidia bacterium]